MILNMRILNIFEGLNWRKVASISPLAARRGDSAVLKI
jgi:hypothetical protein